MTRDTSCLGLSPHECTSNVYWIGVELSSRQIFLEPCTMPGRKSGESVTSQSQRNGDEAQSSPQTQSKNEKPILLSVDVSRKALAPRAIRTDMGIFHAYMLTFVTLSRILQFRDLWSPGYLREFCRRMLRYRETHSWRWRRVLPFLLTTCPIRKSIRLSQSNRALLE